jgi:hypothetical protein
MDEDAPPRTTSKFAHFQDDLFYDVLTPYIVGLEPDSVLIDITSINNVQNLKEFLGNFNINDNHPFFGTLLVERRYLKRCFIETGWDRESAEYEKLISTGLEMPDGTVIKGYLSLSAEAKIARVKIERLPLCHPRKLRDVLTKRFSSIGEVLDVKFHMDGKVFFGQGYVVLNLQPKETKVTEKLSHVLPWPEQNRQLLLTWDEMPPYCRYCQKDDHCRADCPELIKTKYCFECNEQGHIVRDCPRRNRQAPIAPNKRVAIEIVKLRKMPSSTVNTHQQSSPPASPKPIPFNPIAEMKVADQMDIDSSKQPRTEDVISGEENRDPKKFKNAHKEGAQDSNTGSDTPEEPSNGNLKLNVTNIGSSENTISSGVTQTTFSLLQ